MAQNLIIDELFATYCDRFGAQQRSNELVLNRFNRQNRFPRVPALSRTEFENWLLDDWRTPYFKRDWLATFVELSDEGLQGLSVEARSLIVNVLSKLPSELKLAS